MTLPVVWSERNELHSTTGEHDCYVAAPLMCLVYGGKTSYPLGIYTPQEREALERADARPDEEGGTPDDADLGIKNRYGLVMHKVSETSLAAAWQLGRAFSVGGRLSNFPSGNRLRRYAPTYTGGHRVCVIPTSVASGPAEASTGRWLDPLAPWKYVGDTVTLAEVQVFTKGRDVSDLRFTLQNEYATQGGGSQEGLMIYVQTAQSGSFTVPSSAKVYDPGTSGFVASGTLPAGSSGHYDATLGRLSGSGTPSSLIHVSSGNGVSHYLDTAEVNEVPDPAPGVTKLAPGLYEVD